MDPVVDLGLTPALLIHASGALTFCALGQEPAPWEDDDALLAVAA